LMLPHGLSPHGQSRLRKDRICPLDLIVQRICPLGMSCALGNFANQGDREATVSDPGLGLSMAVRALRARLQQAATSIAPMHFYASAPKLPPQQQQQAPPPQQRTRRRPRGGRPPRRAEGIEPRECGARE
jgi:hypothetical protein